MARNVAKNLDHLLILTDPSELVPGFELAGVEYKILKKVPAQAVVELTTSSSNVVGMIEYIVTCIGPEDQKTAFRALVRNSKMDAEGLGEVIEEIIEKTTPFEETKPSA